VVWIGGYPKSGTTWLKFIVAGLLYRTNKPKKVESLIPNKIKRETLKDGIYKVLYFPPLDGKKLYIVRHPVDICVSGINHKALYGGKTDIKRNFKRFIKSKGNVIKDYGVWEDHIKSWVNSDDCYWLKYEDLLKDTHQKTKEIAAFIGADIKNVEYTLKATSFKAMRKLENKNIVGKKKNIPNVFYNPKHKGYKKGLRFINKGKSGVAGEVLNRKQIDIICETFKEGIRLLGYETLY